MPADSSGAWDIVYTVARYLFPFFALVAVFMVLFYILSEARTRRERVRSLPGAGTVGEMVVLTGSRDLDTNTWFPVPREGVLGSVRSCDLVIPCPGVHAKHLDFSWEDGIGLLIHPRTGCEAQINGVSVTCRTDASSFPLTHGGILQVGSAVLRLHLFAALDNTAAPVLPPPEMQTSSAEYIQEPIPVPVVYDPYGLQDLPFRTESGPVLPVSPCPGDASPPAQDTAGPRRSDRWKEEDFGE